MRDTIIAILLGGGTFFSVVAAIGIVRFPDLYMRLSAATKASTLGASLMLAGAGLFFDDAAVTGKITAIIIFIVLTAPVAAHMLGRAAYFSGVPLWEKSVRDDLASSGEWCNRDDDRGTTGPAESGADKK
ncbi:monovalent cation/H(+) antiporter subunit G [Geobacter sp. 60473]|uniref:monovalent cation/H(+) antiporter subunit G n=1 Tax=Geobacter sp. 60473 TaxID=3080755 RepID=UPI002B2A3EFE|nr:monovalent cation/H(+) antiporter subunit G [Geobacter sp. 60473]